MNYFRLSIKLCICIIVLILILLILEKYEAFRNTNDAVVNFLRDPINNPFCPHMTTSRSNTFFNVPNQTDVAMKFCCSSCFRSVATELNNEEGLYRVEPFTEMDLELLRNFHEEENLNSNFPEEVFRKQIGKKVLKKNNLVVQILKENS